MRGHIVYFIQAVGKPFAPVKIGVTNDLERRLDTLQTGSDERLHALGYQKLHTRQAMFERETDLHKKFKSSRLRATGEWFAWTPALQWYMLWRVYTFRQLFGFLLRLVFTGVLNASIRG